MGSIYNIDPVGLVPEARNSGRQTPVKLRLQENVQLREAH